MTNTPVVERRRGSPSETVTKISAHKNHECKLGENLEVQKVDNLETKYSMQSYNESRRH